MFISFKLLLIIVKNDTNDWLNCMLYIIKTLFFFNNAFFNNAIKHTRYEHVQRSTNEEKQHLESHLQDSSVVVLVQSVAPRQQDLPRRLLQPSHLQKPEQSFECRNIQKVSLAHVRYHLRLQYEHLLVPQVQVRTAAPQQEDARSLVVQDAHCRSWMGSG